MKEVAQEKIRALVEKYNEVKAAGKLKSYTEEETKKEFILPLFEALGWEVHKKEEVSAEEKISSSFVDYGFYSDGRVKFYLEAKKLGADLHKEEFANQAIRYSWNKGATWAVLTDFESIKVFNAQVIDGSLSDKLFFEISCTEYLERLDQLWLLSKESFNKNLLDKCAEGWGKKLQRISVTNLLYKDLQKCRAILTKSLSAWNPKVDKDLLDEGVQKLLDRIIFIRVAEDRDIEPKTLIPMIREWEPQKGRITLYKMMVDKFRELDDIYDSNLFSKHSFETWDEYDGSTSEVIKILHGKEGYYEYDFRAMPTDVLGAVYENYLGYKLEQSQKGVAVQKDTKKRKEQGIYYTPTYVVDYIVKNALGPVLNQCKTITDLKKIRILDPACGSGSFLIKAFELLVEKYKEFGVKESSLSKYEILTQNIYGVDLDPQAVEIARLNLLLAALDKKIKLPLLTHNIQMGNSLISGSDDELKKYFGNDFRKQMPFEWEKEFKEIFEQGGFDVVLGNPPWGAMLDSSMKQYLVEKYEFLEYQIDTYVAFIGRAFQLLKEKGRMSFVVPSTWLNMHYFKKIRRLLIENSRLEKMIVFLYQVFNRVTAEICIFVCSKVQPADGEVLVANVKSVEEFGNIQYDKIKQNLWVGNYELGFNTFYSASEVALVNRVSEGTIVLDEIADITVGIKPYQVGKGKPKQTKEDVDNRIFDANTEVDSEYKPYLSGKDFNRYVIFGVNKWIKYGEWLAEPRSSLNFGHKKIVVRQTADKIIAAVDAKGLLDLNNVHNIVITYQSYSEEFVTALLNSKLMDFVYNFFVPETGRVFAEVKAVNLAKMPIKNLNSKDTKIKATSNLIEESVKQMINLQVELQGITKDTEQYDRMWSRVVQLDNEINQLVYTLYGLTPEEIKIIEGMGRIG